MCKIGKAATEKLPPKFESHGVTPYIINNNIEIYLQSLLFISIGFVIQIIKKYLHARLHPFFKLIINSIAWNLIIFFIICNYIPFCFFAYSQLFYSDASTTTGKVNLGVSILATLINVLILVHFFTLISVADICEEEIEAQKRRKSVFNTEHNAAAHEHHISI